MKRSDIKYIDIIANRARYWFGETRDEYTSKIYERLVKIEGSYELRKYFSIFR